MREISMLLLVLGFMQAHSFAYAKGKKKTNLDLTPPGQTASENEDPGSATRLLYEDPRNQNSITAGTDEKTQALSGQVKSTCTDNMGMIYKKGAAGYDGCLRTFGKAPPSAVPGNKRNNSVGISIGQ
jgi:hypothetical protein